MTTEPILRQKAINFRVLCDGDYLGVLRSIRAHRWLYRVLASYAGMAESMASVPAVKAGGFRVKIDAPVARELMRVVAGAVAPSGAPESRSSGKPYYELRNVFSGGVEKLRAEGIADFPSHVWDCMVVDLTASHRKKDPDLNGLPRYIRQASGGVDGLRAARAGIRVMRSCGRNYAEMREYPDGRKEIILDWDRLLGPVTFVLEGEVKDGEKTFSRKPDTGAAWIFHKLTSGEWKWATPTLNERDGKFFINVPYVRPFDKAETDPSQVLEVSFMPRPGEELRDEGRMLSDGEVEKTFFIHCRKAGVGSRVYRIPVDDAVMALDRVQALHQKRELERDCCRRERKASKKKALRRKVEALTRKRSNIERTTNHRWARDAVNAAIKWGCGTIRVYGPPKGKVDAFGNGGLLGHSWNWCQFKNYVEDKAAERGIVVESRPEPDASLVKELIAEAIPAATR